MYLNGYIPSSTVGQISDEFLWRRRQSNIVSDVATMTSTATAAMMMAATTAMTSTQEKWILHGVKSLSSKVVMTFGDQECYFGGEPSFTRVGAILAAEMIHFAGRHAREDQATIETAILAALIT